MSGKDIAQRCLMASVFVLVAPNKHFMAPLQSVGARFMPA
jgi:hypothetical protein